MQMNNRECRAAALDAAMEDLAGGVRRFDREETARLDRIFGDIFLGGFTPEPARLFFRLVEIRKETDKSVDTLAENLRLFTENREEAESRYAGGLRRLSDFVSLESARLACFDAGEDMRERRAAQMIGRADAASARAEEARDKLGRFQRESVAAVGLVAAILAAFFAGIGWSASVLENIEKATVYRLSGMTLLIVLGLFNLLALLMSFIRSMTGTADTRFRTVYACGNALLLLLLALAGAAWLFDLSEARPLLADWLRACLGAG